ncbi:MAG TPA: Plug domain-containing protein, partial [Saprospiraceae bacterium]|nr:Plug domain-containing protein [Saprospiraceae bacterium]
MKVFSFIVIAFLLFSNAILAQETAVDLSDTITEVVITSTRKSVTPLRSPYSTATIDRKVMDQYQYRSVPEALMGTTGVFIQKTNHGGGSAFVRGLTGNQTLTLVDGIRLNNSTVRYGPNQYLNTIDPYSVSKIEVVRGSGSVQYGSDAMGGVVQILT